MAHKLPFDIPASGMIADRILNVDAGDDTALQGQLCRHIGWARSDKGEDVFRKSLLQTGMHYVGSEIHNCLISGINGQNIVFENCNATENTFSDFKGAHGQVADWGMVTINNGDWTNNTFKHVCANDAVIKTDLRGSTFYGCSLVNTDLRGSLGDDVLFTSGRIPVQQPAGGFCISKEDRHPTNIAGCKMDLDFALAATFDKVCGLFALEIYDGDRRVTGFGVDSWGRLRPKKEKSLSSLFGRVMGKTVPMSVAMEERGILFTPITNNTPNNLKVVHPKKD